MPFDPNKPAQGSPNSSAEMRGQLNGLKDLIDAITTINGTVVDGVTTLPPGDPATVFLSVTGNTMHFTFGIPQGEVGPQGQQGQQGVPGEVTQSDLNNAMVSVLSQSSNTSNAVAVLGQLADGSYNPTQMQDVVNKLDELILALRR